CSVDRRKQFLRLPAIPRIPRFNLAIWPDDRRTQGVRNAVAIVLVEDAKEIGQVLHLAGWRTGKLPVLEIFFAVALGVSSSIATKDFRCVVLWIEADAEQMRLCV